MFMGRSAEFQQIQFAESLIIFLIFLYVKIYIEVKKLNCKLFYIFKIIDWRVLKTGILQVSTPINGQ